MSIKIEHKTLEIPYTRDRVKGVLPAFVMRARLISRPHYVRLRIIAIHIAISHRSHISILIRQLETLEKRAIIYKLIYCCVFHEGRQHFITLLMLLLSKERIS